MVTQESYMNSHICNCIFRQPKETSVLVYLYVLIGVQCYSFIFSRNMPRSSILYLPNHTATLCLLASIYIMHHVILCNFWNHFLYMCLAVLGFDVNYFPSLLPSSICSYADVKRRPSTPLHASWIYNNLIYDSCLGVPSNNSFPLVIYGATITQFLS